MNVAVTSSSLWVTADGTDSANIMITVTDGTNKAIGGASIQLGVTPPWELRDTQGITPDGGQFVTGFLPTTMAGTAVITATVTVPGVTDVPVVATYSQNITADTPAKAEKSYTGTASVGSITDITIRVTDQYGNPVSSKKKKTNTISFATTPYGDNAFVVSVPDLWGGGDHKVKVKGFSVALNDSGYADADFALSTHPGDNFVIITLPYPLPVTLITIQGIANAVPSHITKTITPGGHPPTLKTDNTSRFTINYMLYDRYGNPSLNRNLSISASSGESRVITSNNEGKVTILYGPKTGAGRYTITARSVDNPSVYTAQTVQFLSGKPVDMLLTASPQTMASLDVKEDAMAWVMAKVIDDNGNPVAGQTVSFSLASVNTGTYNQTEGPVLETDRKTDRLDDEVASVTDENGLAAANFYPGTFTTDSGAPGFSPLAEGIARVRARWSGVTHEIDLSYKNFPYLSVYSSAEPGTIEVNETVDVSIRVRGDGYALQPRPIDVFMVTDRSGSMLSDYPDRMVHEMKAAKTFATKFDFKSDRLGQFSFGTNGEANAGGSEDCGKDGVGSDDSDYSSKNYPQDGKTYGDYATLDLGLSTVSKDITDAISGLVPSGWTPMRYALYRAIGELKNAGRPDSVRAIVLLSDGDYNIYGDPLARGSPGSATDPRSYKELTTSYMKFDLAGSQNMAEYAKANNIRIYAIGYGKDLSDGGQHTLETLATSTGGKYFYALTGDDLTNFYAQIAGALKDTAGVNTNLAMDFSGVEVNGAPVTPGSKVLRYEPIAGRSTRVTRPDGSGYDVDNSADWKGGRLNVPLGTIKVNQEYVVNFTMTVLAEGNIRIVDSGNSRVNFDDDKGSVPTPDIYITALPTGKDKGITPPVFEIRNLKRTNSDNNVKSADLLWEILYVGGSDPTIREEIEVAPLNSEAYSYRGTTFADNGDTSDTYTMDISDLQPGMYKARVTGFVDDAGSSFNITRFSVPAGVQNPQIVIH